MKHLLKHYWLTLSITVLVWLFVAIFSGPAAFVMVVILTLLEITLSADNAVINSRVLGTMSPLWRRLFMTVGILIAVFIIRFAIPILVVALTTPLSVSQTVQLALQDPTTYGEKLEHAAPMINAFGGIFLGLVAVFFFVDARRRDLWIRPVERPLSRAGKWRVSRPLIALLLSGGVFLLAGESMHQQTIGISIVAALVIYGVLHGAVEVMERFGGNQQTAHKTGWAAFMAFLYLETLDASFSLDGVVGAFALTNNVVIIMAGLGVGAIWVRSMTLHLTNSNTLAKYRYLESGAHWAIAFLALIMLLKLFYIEVYEIIVGTVGLICIGLSLLSSHSRRI